MDFSMQQAFPAVRQMLQNKFKPVKSVYVCLRCPIWQSKEQLAATPFVYGSFPKIGYPNILVLIIGPPKRYP